MSREQLAAAIVAALCVALAAAVVPVRAENEPAAPRASLLPLVRPLWSELTPAQQAVLGPFATQWNSWSAQEKRIWVSLASRVPRMAPDARERAHERIREWAALTPDQRRLARQNYRLAKRLPPDERQAQWERYQEMTPEQRSVLRSAGWTSNTAARHAGARTGLAKEAAQPLSDLARRTPKRPPPRPKQF